MFDHYMNLAYFWVCPCPRRYLSFHPLDHALGYLLQALILLTFFLPRPGELVADAPIDDYRSAISRDHSDPSPCFGGVQEGGFPARGEP